jgi:pSer/pThr/pTyr-binding forkhead associated (FHA) protein
VRYTKVRVEVVRGPDAGSSVDVAGRTVKVGTADDNQLVLTDDSVSRSHCELEPVPGGMRVRDIGSTNGVFAGGVRFYDAVLPFDSRLSLGDTELALSALAETVEREQTTRDRFGDLIGASPRMRELFADLERIAGSDVTLLIEGETGTGKDVVA